MVDNQKVGKFILECRKEKNMTQQQIADNLFLTRKAVSKWERGLSLPDIGQLEPLAELLGISVAELLKGEKIDDIEDVEVDCIITDTVETFLFTANKKSNIKILLTLLLCLLVVTGIVVYYSFCRMQNDYMDICQSVIYGEENAMQLFECVTDVDRNVLHILTEDEYKDALFYAGGSLKTFGTTDSVIEKYPEMKNKSEELYADVETVYNEMYEFDGYEGTYYVKDYDSFCKTVNELYDSCLALREVRRDFEREVGLRD
ncbi:MAG: helix-turn-helix transcriptional regulator [Firmicutes bacterium]|nr:helix-turn-helix transcriptional regulator [Bacillota bacterium]